MGEPKVRNRWRDFIAEVGLAARVPYVTAAGFFFLACGIAVWRQFWDPPLSLLVETLVTFALIGVYSCIQYLETIRAELAEMRQEARAMELARAWQSKYSPEIIAELSAQARADLDLITKTKLYSWVETYHEEVRRLPVEARQTIYEIAGTRR